MTIYILIGIVLLICFLIYKNLYSPLRKYNGMVDSILKEEYGIVTLGNPDFMDSKEYSKTLLNLLNQNCNFDLAALKIATFYCNSLIKKQKFDSAKQLHKKIIHVVAISGGRGLFSPEDAASELSPLTIELSKNNLL